MAPQLFPEPSSTSFSRRFWWPGFILILLFAAALRWHYIGFQPLWLDEGYSWWDAHQSLTDLWSLVPQCDPHPPLYALLLKAWMGLFGDSALAMRSLGALAGVLATGFVMLAGRELAPRLGWIAGLIFASMPFQVEFAHEARPYGLVALGSAVLAFGVLRVLGQRERLVSRSGWLGVVAGLGLLLWSNDTSVFYGAALLLALGWLSWRDPEDRALWRPAAWATLAVLLLWAPYLPNLLTQTHEVSSDFWIPRPNLWRVANELRFLVGFGSFFILWWVLALWGVGLALLVRWGRGRQALVLGALAVVPLALNFVLSWLITPIFLARTLIGTAPFFALALAAAPAALSRPRLRGLLVAALVTAQVLTLAPLYVDYHRKEPWDVIGAEASRDGWDLTAGHPDQALVLFIPDELVLPFSHAMEALGQRLPMHGVPRDYPSLGMHARYPSGKCAPAVEGLDLSFLTSLTAGRRAVLLLTRQYNSYDPGDRIPAYLASHGWRQVALRAYEFGDLRLFEFVPEGGAPRPAP